MLPNGRAAAPSRFATVRLRVQQILGRENSKPIPWGRQMNSRSSRPLLAALDLAIARINSGSRMKRIGRKPGTSRYFRSRSSLNTKSRMRSGVRKCRITTTRRLDEREAVNAKRTGKRAAAAELIGKSFEASEEIHVGVPDAMTTPPLFLSNYLNRRRVSNRNWFFQHHPCLASGVFGLLLGTVGEFKARTDTSRTNSPGER